MRLVILHHYMCILLKNTYMEIGKIFRVSPQINVALFLSNIKKNDYAHDI